MGATTGASGFSDWLEGELARKGWTQSELGRRVGVSRQQVSRWLLGDYIPELPNCRALADALGVPYIDVLAAVGYLPPMDTPRERLVMLVRYLPDDRVSEATTFIEYLMDRHAAEQAKP